MYFDGRIETQGCCALPTFKARHSDTRTIFVRPASRVRKKAEEEFQGDTDKSNTRSISWNLSWSSAWTAHTDVRLNNSKGALHPAREAY